MSGLIISEALGLGSKESNISSDNPYLIHDLTSFNSSVAFKYSLEATSVRFVFSRSWFVEEYALANLVMSAGDGNVPLSNMTVVVYQKEEQRKTIQDHFFFLARHHSVELSPPLKYITCTYINTAAKTTYQSLSTAPWKC
jgi:hypothetical protein